MTTLKLIKKLTTAGLYPSCYGSGYAVTINGDYPVRWIDHLDLVEVIEEDFILVNKMFTIYKGEVLSFNWETLTSPVSKIDALALTTIRLS